MFFLARLFLMYLRFIIFDITPKLWHLAISLLTALRAFTCEICEIALCTTLILLLLITLVLLL